MITNVLKILFPTLFAFLFGVLITPYISSFLYKHKLWKKKAREIDNTGDFSEEYTKIHNTEDELRTPRIGGVVIWISVLATTLVMFAIAHLSGDASLDKINFLSRNQTLLLIFALIVGGLVGLMDDLSQILIRKHGSDGFSGWKFAGIVFIIALVSAFWFFTKLDMSSITTPFIGVIKLGIFFIPFFILVTMGIFSSGVIDGIDGLAGGVFAIVFITYGVIALFQNQVDIAAFSFVVTSSIVAFLWFNVPPARFYMGETGMLALVLPLSLIVFLTDQVLLFLIIGFPLVATSLSSFIQIAGYKLLKRRLLPIAPLHHYFEHIGWSRERITMRYWIISTMCALTGLVVFLLG